MMSTSKALAILSRKAPIFITVCLTIALTQSLTSLFNISHYSANLYPFNNTSVPSINIIKQIIECDNATQLKQDQTQSQVQTPIQTENETRTPVIDIRSIQSDMKQWISHLRQKSNDSQSIISKRTTCHELDAKAQTCVFEGILCINVSSTVHQIQQGKRPKIYIIDDSKEDHQKVPSDDWCSYLWKSADPRYYASRHWPLLDDTIVPQQSCMDAAYRTSKSLLTNDIGHRIKWLSSIALLDVDHGGNDHNTHFAIDTLWILDAFLHDESMSMQQRPGYPIHRQEDDHDGLLLRTDVHYYIPQTHELFLQQTIRDVNRLLFSIILRKDSRKLYRNITDYDLFQYHNINTSEEIGKWERHTTEQLLDVYPELQSKFHFHGDIIKDTNTELVCTPRLTTGMKTGFSTAERVCREIRTRAFELYGIQRPVVKPLGQIVYPQPPRSILVLDRHYTRKIANADQFVSQLTDLMKKHDVDVKYTTTDKVFTAEDFVRIFSSAGVVIAAHGGQNMGQMFMHRHRYVIFFFFIVLLAYKLLKEKTSNIHSLTALLSYSRCLCFIAKHFKLQSNKFTDVIYLPFSFCTCAKQCVD